MPKNEQSRILPDPARSTTPLADTKTTTPPRQDELARQRHCWQRRPWLECGCSQSCRCEHKRNPSDKRVTAYREAVEHLAEHKLDAAPLMAEARQLWRRGGSDRAVADRVVRRWTA